jgi:hypothetical protein
MYLCVCRTCMKNEVLTFTLGVKKISRITLGALEDLGYLVNYTVADPYGMEDIGVCSGCDIVGRRYMKGNDDLKVAESKTSPCHSGDVHERTVQHVRKMLRNAHVSTKTSKYVENQQVTVAYLHEDGTVCSVVVPGYDLF